MKQEKKEKNIVVMVPISMYKDFQEACSANYQSMSEILRSYMRDKIKKHKEEKDSI